MSLIASDHFRIVVGLGKSGMSLVRYLAPVSYTHLTLPTILRV